MVEFSSNLTCLNSEDLDFLLSYPDLSPEKRQERKQELQSLSLDEFYSWGNVSFNHLKILGSGYQGIVILGKKEQQYYALKIRRGNAPKPNFQQEILLLSLANRYGIAPRIWGGTDNFILMDYVQGRSFLDWLAGAIAAGGFTEIRAVLENLMEQAFTLDQKGLDRGDMGCITRDVIVTANHQPVLLDFSNGSCDRRPQNVTALIQGLFWGSVTADLLKPLFPHCTPEQLLPYLKQYKKDPSQTQFFALKRALDFRFEGCGEPTSHEFWGDQTLGIEDCPEN